VDAEDQKRAVQEYIRCITAHDLEAVEALYAPDACLEDPVGSDPLKGIEAIREFYAKAFAMGVSAESTGEARCAGNAVAFPFRITVRMGENQMTIDVIDVFEFNASGKIQSMKAYWGPENSKTKPIPKTRSKLPN